MVLFTSKSVCSNLIETSMYSSYINFIRFVDVMRTISSVDAIKNFFLYYTSCSNFYLSSYNSTGVKRSLVLFKCPMS